MAEYVRCIDNKAVEQLVKVNAVYRLLDDANNDPHSLWIHFPGRDNHRLARHRFIPWKPQPGDIITDVREEAFWVVSRLPKPGETWQHEAHTPGAAVDCFAEALTSAGLTRGYNQGMCFGPQSNFVPAIDVRPLDLNPVRATDLCTDPDNCGQCKGYHENGHAGIPLTARTYLPKAPEAPAPPSREDQLREMARVESQIHITADADYQAYKRLIGK